MKIITPSLLSLLFFCGFAAANMEIEEWRTPEGAKVLWTKAKGLPMLDIALSFDAASSRDGAQFGLASMTNSLIGSSTKSKNEEQIIRDFEELGANISTASLKDMALVSLRTLTRDEVLRRAVSLFAEVVGEVEFKQKYLNRAKKQAAASIDAGKQSPNNIAFETFEQAVFAGHPYAHPDIGTKKSLATISTSDLRQHYQKYYVAKNLNIAMVGDISRVKAKQIARQISHKLNVGVAAKSLIKVQKLAASNTIHIKFPSAQTHIFLGQTGINRSHPDYYALFLGNHIFGASGLNSILADEVREQRGLAYSVSSSLAKMRSNGYFLLTLQTKNSQTAEAKKVTIETFRKFLAQPLSHEKLQDGKSHIIASFFIKAANNSERLAYLSIIGFYDLPLNYLKNFSNKIKPITALEVQNAFLKLIDTKKWVMVTVGGEK